MQNFEQVESIENTEDGLQNPKLDALIAELTEQQVESPLFKKYVSALNEWALASSDWVQNLFKEEVEEFNGWEWFGIEEEDIDEIGGVIAELHTNPTLYNEWVILLLQVMIVSSTLDSEHQSLLLDWIQKITDAKKTPDNQSWWFGDDFFADFEAAAETKNLLWENWELKTVTTSWTGWRASYSFDNWTSIWWAVKATNLSDWDNEQNSRMISLGMEGKNMSATYSNTKETSENAVTWVARESTSNAIKMTVGSARNKEKMDRMFSN